MLLRSPPLEAAGFAHAFPTRETPDAALLDALAAARITQIKQVHGARALLATDAQAPGSDSQKEGVEEGDALVSRAEESPSAGGAIGVRVADCVPILVANTRTGDVAAIHAGWRGLVAGVIPQAITLLAPTGRSHLVAAIGPCIGPCCFEVGRDVAAQIGFIVHASPAKAYVDLRAAARAQLSTLGIPRIDDVPGCTKHDPDRFHSFRRDGAHSGRMLAAITPRR